MLADLVAETRAVLLGENLPRETLMALAAAVTDASDRGHRPVRVIHLTRALMLDPFVVAALERRGVATELVYAELESLLPAPAPPLNVLSMSEAGVDSSLAAVVAASRGKRPAAVLDIIRRSDPEIAAVFERERPVGPSSPYRGVTPSTAKGDSLLVFWNDATTTQSFVLQLLRDDLGIGEPRATYIMRTTHRDGSAIVGGYEAAEATRLAAKAEQRARAEGFPLRVTVEDASFTSPLRRLARWLRRP